MEVRGVGALGEVRAEQYLQAQGYEILGRNYRCPGAEIDLIAREGNTIVFVEVKTRIRALASFGREAVTAAKQRRICLGAMHFMVQYGLAGRQARFDVMEIQGTQVTHIRNAFPYQGPAV